MDLGVKSALVCHFLLRLYIVVENVGFILVSFRIRYHPVAENLLPIQLMLEFISLVLIYKGFLECLTPF